MWRGLPILCSSHRLRPCAASLSPHCPRPRRSAAATHPLFRTACAGARAHPSPAREHRETQHMTASRSLLAHVPPGTSTSARIAQIGKIQERVMVAQIIQASITPNPEHCHASSPTPCLNQWPRRKKPQTPRCTFSAFSTREEVINIQVVSEPGFTEVLCTEFIR